MDKPKMKLTKAERHMAENQVAFRNINQRIPNGFQELLKIAEEDKQTSLVELPKGLLLFCCECSDRNCNLRIRMKLRTWERIHKHPDRFCVAKGHTVPQIEDVIKKYRRYDIVKKKIVPKQDATHFWPTRVHFV